MSILAQSSATTWQPHAGDEVHSIDTEISWRVYHVHGREVLLIRNHFGKIRTVRLFTHQVTAGGTSNVQDELIRRLANAMTVEESARQGRTSP